MKIENLLTDVANYFRNKVLTGDYEFVKCSDRTADIIIDGKYTLQLWIANDPKNHFGFYSPPFSVGHDFIQLRTQKERLQGWKHLKPFVENYRNNTLKREKLKEFERLKKELEALS